MSKKRRAKERVTIDDDFGKTEMVLKEPAPAQTIDIPSICITEVEEETTDVVESETFCTKPCIIVKLESKNLNSAAKLKISGWKVSEQIFHVLQIMLPSLGHLSSLQFWQAGLTDAMVVSLNQTINLSTLSATLRSVTLEGNALPEQSFHHLLHEDSVLTTLSLRNNRIGDEGARLIGQALSTCTSTNKNLLTLNLAFNCIGNEGAGYIAKGLRFNRTLLFLSLCNNRIGNLGAVQLAGVLSEFPLTHEEIKERRKLILVKIQAMCPKPDFLNEDQKGIGKGENKSSTQSKEASKKEEKITEGKEKTFKKAATKMMQSKMTRVGGKDKPSPAAEDKTTAKEVELAEYPCSLLDLPMNHKDDHLYFQGNKTLSSLNLAGNQITETALPFFLKSLEKTDDGGSLVRLCLQRNKFPPDNEVYMKIKELALARNDKDFNTRNGDIKEEPW